jgi:tRNA U34 2-thiouridine synthase MnmA/TrmU
LIDQTSFAINNYLMNLITRAKDANKDQTYFIWQIKQEQLPHILFPVGEFDVKSKVREFAESKGLITSNKPDSQGLCFVGQTSLREMLLQTLGRKDGFIYVYLTEEQINKLSLTVHKKNKSIVANSDKFKIKLGNHEGAFLFTIGQRQNLGLSNGPWFVAEVDIVNNEVIVCHSEYQEEIMSKILIIKDLNWHLDITQESSYTKSRELITNSEKLKVKNIIKDLLDLDLESEAVILNSIQDLKSSEFESNTHLLNTNQNSSDGIFRLSCRGSDLGNPDLQFSLAQDDSFFDRINLDKYKIYQLTLKAQIRYRSQAQNCQVFVFLPKLDCRENPPDRILNQVQDDNSGVQVNNLRFQAQTHGSDTVVAVTNTPFAIVEFDQPIKAAAKGQSIVFYDCDTDQYLIGGGVIESVIKNRLFQNSAISDSESSTE